MIVQPPQQYLTIFVMVVRIHQPEVEHLQKLGENLLTLWNPLKYYCHKNTQPRANSSWMLNHRFSNHCWELHAGIRTAANNIRVFTYTILHYTIP